MWPFTKAQKQTDVIDDDFDLDDLLDPEMFTTASEQVEDNRTPVAKVTDSALDGVKTGLLKSTDLEHVLEKVLPKEYGETYSAVNSHLTKVRDLYADTVKDIKPGLKDLRRNTLKLFPQADRESMPAPIARFLDKLQEGENQDKGRPEVQALSADEQREAMLGKTLGELFRSQSTLDQEREVRQLEQVEVTRAFDLKKHKDQLSLMASVESSLSRMDQYQRTIGLDVSKTRMEMQ